VARRVLDYIDLHKPPQHRLSMTKKVKLIRSLLIDLERHCITRGGREWITTPDMWGQAIDQMLTSQLELPLKGHGYLYAVLQSMSDKSEAKAEQQAEEQRRTGGATTTRPTAMVRGRAESIANVLGNALTSVTPSPERTLAALDQRDRTAAPMPANVRAQLAALRGKKPNPQE
jgi:hypothetical protein